MNPDPISSTGIVCDNAVDSWFCHNLLRVWNTGEVRPGRNGSTRSLFGRSLTLDLREGFPALTAKRMNLKASVAETLCFLAGDDNAAAFRARGCNFWDANAGSAYWMANPNRRGTDDLGRIYGVQWRHWNGTDGQGKPRVVDQLQALLNGLRSDPYGRRHLVTAWQPAELDQMALPPCHVLFQVYCHVDGGISLQMYQRSCDLFLGVPFNITGYALVLEILAALTGRYAKELTLVFGDLHVYEAHEYEDHALTRLRDAALSAAEDGFKLPKLDIRTDLKLQDFALPDMNDWAKTENFVFPDYRCGPFIAARMVE